MGEGSHWTPELSPLMEEGKWLSWGVIFFRNLQHYFCTRDTLIRNRTLVDERPVHFIFLTGAMTKTETDEQKVKSCRAELNYTRRYLRYLENASLFDCWAPQKTLIKTIMTLGVVTFGERRVVLTLFLSSLIYPLTARVVGAPQMISQPVSSIFPCSPLPSGTWRTPGLSHSLM